MSKYAVLKQERDDAVERAVIAERNSQLERLRELEATHAAERAELLTEIGRLEAELVRVRLAFESAVAETTRLLRASLESPGEAVRPVEAGALLATPEAAQ